MNRVYEPSGPVTKEFLLDDSFIRGIMGPFGCVAGDTLVITEFGPTPIEDIKDPVRVLSWCGKSNQFVFALSGGAFPKGRDYLYRVSTPQGEFDASGHHRILCADGKYRPVETLAQGQSVYQCSADLQGSSDGGRWLSRRDVRRYSQRVVDYLGNYARLAHQYGQQLLVPLSVDQFFSPLPVDAQTLACPDGEVVDVRWGGHWARSQLHNRLGQPADLIRIGDSFYLSALHEAEGVGLSSDRLFSRSAGLVRRFWRSLQTTARHLRERLSGGCSGSYSGSLSERNILSVTRKGVKEVYWDMQVVDTNNYVTIDGTIHHNSGKSVACCIDIFRRACEQKPNHENIRRTRWAIIRNTYPELVTTTIKTWFDWISRDLGKFRAQGPPTHFLDFQLEDGTKVDAEVMFLALDSAEDVKKLLSLELTGAWVNECREVPESVIKALRGRVGRFPSQADGGQTWTGIILDTNPPDTDSWYYKLAEELQPKKHKFFRQPSGLAEDGENKQNLPPDYYENICVGADEDFIKVHVHGEYGFVMDGKPVYPEYKQSIHCQQIEKYKKAPLYIGIDFGLTPAAAICQRGPRGEWLVLDEVATDDMGAQRFAEVLKAFLNENYHDHKMFIYGDPSGDNRAQTDETTPFMILRKNGIAAVPAPSNDPVQRKEALKAPLSRLIDGIPGMRIAPHCERINKGLMGGYHYKRMRVSGKDKYKDLPEKNMYSHIIEALEYAMLGAGEGKGIFGGARTPKHLKYDNRGIV